MRISPYLLSVYHPAGVTNPSDIYYANLATKLFNATRKTRLGRYLNQDERAELALRLALYTEDIVADLGIWRSFVERHRVMYGRDLPFYETADYEPDIPHLEDVKLLIWLMLNDFELDNLFSPLAPSIIETATSLFPMIDQAFDRAPENTDLRHYLHQAPFMDDFLEMRNMLEYYFSQCYLTRSLQTDDCLEHEIEVAENNFKHQCRQRNITDPIYYSALCTAVFTCKVGPLALLPQQWVANLLRSNGAAGKAMLLDQMRYLPLSMYEVITYDDATITLKSVALETIALSRHSFNDNVNDALHANDVFMGTLVCYNITWVANGISLWLKAKQQYRQLRDEYQERKRNQKDYDFTPLVNKNGGRQVFYFNTLAECKEFFAQHGQKEALDDVTEDNLKAQNYTVFINPETANFSVIGDIATCIKDENNPLYNAQKAPDGAHEIITDTDKTADELVHYLTEHDMMPDASFANGNNPEEGRRLMQDNLDFFARTMRRNDY